jgi:hypothetical protein
LFYVSGQFDNHGAPIRRLTAVSPEGWRVELAPSFSLRTLDTLVSKFCAHFELPLSSPLSDGWIFELADVDGATVESTAPAVVVDRAVVRKCLLADLEHAPKDDETVLGQQIGPAIAQLQSMGRAAAEPARIQTIGPRPKDVDVSLIVTLDERIDLFEQQLIQFALDPDLARAELMYALQSPQPAAELLDRAGQLHDLYGLSMRFVVPREAITAAQAVNSAAEVAGGRLLFITRSSILPTDPGWLSRLARFYDASPAAGAVGAKLLYPTGHSVSSAGVDIAKSASDGRWQVQPRCRGLHRLFSAANTTGRVAAVADGFLISAQALRGSGCWNDLYLSREYAQTDFCLRLRATGRENSYLCDIEFLSFNDAAAPPAEMRFDGWLFKHLWQDQIAALAGPLDASHSSNMSEVLCPSSKF